MVKSGQAWAGLVVTRDATGALAAASVGPAGTLYVNGTSNGAGVTITGSNPYKWAVTLPSLTAGDSVSMYITATVGGIASAAVVAEDVADTKRVSDLNDAAAALDAAGTRAAVGLSAANLDNQLSALPTATENADELLKRDWSAVTGEAARSVLNALRFLRNKWAIASGTLTVYKEDDATSAWTGTTSSETSSDVVTGVDP